MRHIAAKGMLVLVVLLASTGCSHFFVQKDAYLAVKKVAVVQHAINPHLLLGSANVPEAKTQTAEANVKTFVQVFTGGRYEVVPLDVLKAQAAYAAAGLPSLDGYYTAPGMRFVTGPQAVESATLTPDLAKKLAEDLGVDAVAVVYESWGLAPYALGFKAKSLSTFVINMYDRNGVRVWGDVASGESDEGMATPGGIIATELTNLVLNFNQSYSVALTTMKNRLASVQ
ncbi:hypothetical protein JGU66_01100 [Myxococcaceae bacterium JPH2]|nr:hypothetical protein [Myxococcaceae bacterium JPH2]